MTVTLVSTVYQTSTKYATTLYQTSFPFSGEPASHMLHIPEVQPSRTWKEMYSSCSKVVAGIGKALEYPTDNTLSIGNAVINYLSLVEPTPTVVLVPTTITVTKTATNTMGHSTLILTQPTTTIPEKVTTFTSQTPKISFRPTLGVHSKSTPLLLPEASISSPPPTSVTPTPLLPDVLEGGTDRGTTESSQTTPSLEPGTTEFDDSQTIDDETIPPIPVLTTVVQNVTAATFPTPIRNYTINITDPSPTTENWLTNIFRYNTTIMTPATLLTDVTGGDTDSETTQMTQITPTTELETTKYDDNQTVDGKTVSDIPLLSTEVENVTETIYSTPIESTTKKNLDLSPGTEIYIDNITTTFTLEPTSHSINITSMDTATKLINESISTTEMLTEVSKQTTEYIFDRTEPSLISSTTTQEHDSIITTTIENVELTTPDNEKVPVHTTTTFEYDETETSILSTTKPINYTTFVLLSTISTSEMPNLTVQFSNSSTFPTTTDSIFMTTSLSTKDLKTENLTTEVSSTLTTSFSPTTLTTSFSPTTLTTSFPPTTLTTSFSPTTLSDVSNITESNHFSITSTQMPIDHITDLPSFSNESLDPKYWVKTVIGGGPYNVTSFKKNMEDKLTFVYREAFEKDLRTEANSTGLFRENQAPISLKPFNWTELGINSNQMLNKNMTITNRKRRKRFTPERTTKTVRRRPRNRSKRKYIRSNRMRRNAPISESSSKRKKYRDILGMQERGYANQYNQSGLIDPSLNVSLEKLRTKRFIRSDRINVKVHNSSYFPERNETDIIYTVFDGVEPLLAADAVDSLDNVIHHDMTTKIGHTVRLTEGENQFKMLAPSKFMFFDAFSKVNQN